MLKLLVLSSQECTLHRRNSARMLGARASQGALWHCRAHKHHRPGYPAAGAGMHSNVLATCFALAPSSHLAHLLLARHTLRVLNHQLRLGQEACALYLHSSWLRCRGSAGRRPAGRCRPNASRLRRTRLGGGCSRRGLRLQRIMQRKRALGGLGDAAAALSLCQSRLCGGAARPPRGLCSRRAGRLCALRLAQPGTEKGVRTARRLCALSLPRLCLQSAGL